MSLVKKLFKNSFIIFVGTVIASAFSYLFNMLMGRMLGPVQYGEMTALMSLMMIAAVGGGAIVTISMRYSGELYAAKKIQALKKLYLYFSKYAFFASLIIFGLGILFSKYIAQFFSLPSIVPIIIVFSVIVASFVMMVNRGVLQGTQKFYTLSGVGIVEMVLRLVLGVILVKIGLGLNGALSALVLSTAITYIISIFFIVPLFSNINKNSDRFKFDKKEIIKYSVPAFLVAIVLIIFLNIDIVLVKHYFPSQDAGLYAAVSTIAKIILYFLAPINSVMFPMVSERKIKKTKHYQVFLFSIILTIVGGLLIVGAYVVAPGKIISTLYGSEYVFFYKLLPEVAIAMLFLTLINLIANYYMAIKKFACLWPMGLVLVLQIALIMIWHPSIEVVVRILIVTFALLFAIMMGYYLVSKKNQIIKFIENGKES